MGHPRVRHNRIRINQVAAHHNQTHQIIIMCTATPVLVRIHPNNRCCFVAYPVPRGIQHHVFHFRRRCVADYRYRIFTRPIIRHNVDTEGVRPVVMQLIVLARNTRPIDGTVVIHMLQDNVALGIELRVE